MEFQTNRLLIRPWKDTDSPSLYTYAANPNIGPAAGWPVHQSEADSLEIIQTALADELTFAITLKEKPQTAIGSIGIMEPRNITLMGDKDWEIGYWLAEPFWGEGLIPEAVTRLIDYAFTTLNAENLWCGYYEGNHKSKRVQEKCGFRYVTSQENVYLPLLNEYRTERFTRLTKSGWQNDKT